MKFYDYNNYSLFVVGDIHGEFKNLFNKIKSGTSKKNDSIEEEHPLLKNELKKKKLALKITATNYIYDNSVIVVAGDCGIGFNKEQYYIDLFNKYNELFSKTNTIILFVRGNHDDPSYFSEERINFSNIKTIPDYSVIATKGNMTLCIGGAISIDRSWRKQQEAIINKYKKSYYKKLYWENEQCVYSKELIDEIINNNIPINSIISHSSPNFAEPKEKTNSVNWFKIDSNLSKDINDERKILSDIHKYLNKNGIDIKFWCYGHFHISNVDYKSINKKKIAMIALSNDFNISSPNQTLQFLELENNSAPLFPDGRFFVKPLWYEGVSPITATIGDFENNDNVDEEVHENAEDTIENRLRAYFMEGDRNIRNNEENIEEVVHEAPIHAENDDYEMDDVDEAPF